MTQRQIIGVTLRLLGRTDVANIMDQSGVLNTENGEMVTTLIYCFNAVEDELARNYLPLKASEEMFSDSGDFMYKDFGHTPVTIKRVICGGEDIKFEVFPQFVRAGVNKATVVYDYAPKKKGLSDESDFGYRIVSLGMAAEYCLINGEVEAAGLWEKKYREAIDAAQSRLPVCGNIPPRRWV